jgi:hypothetical protein
MHCLSTSVANARPRFSASSKTELKGKTNLNARNYITQFDKILTHKFVCIFLSPLDKKISSEVLPFTFIALVFLLALFYLGGRNFGILAMACC